MAMSDDWRSATWPGGTARVVIAVVAVLGLVACQGVPSPDVPGESAQVSAATGSEVPGASGPPSRPAVDAARAAIERATLSDPDSISELSAVRFTDEGAAAAAEVIQSGATGDALWAATWIYGAFGTDPAVLLPLVSTADTSVRAIAAATLLAWGQREAAGVLVALLSAEGVVRGSEPPLSIAAFARSTLDRFVDGPTIPADATPGEHAEAWQSWLAENEASMQFDLDAATWRRP